MKNLEPLTMYQIEREDFRQIYNTVEDYIYQEYKYEDDVFKFWRYDEEFYVLHKPSGTIINWYKHLGRTNTCNKDLILEEHKEFARLFLIDMEEHDVHTTQ